MLRWGKLLSHVQPALPSLSFSRFLGKQQQQQQQEQPQSNKRAACIFFSRFFSPPF
jgi:hypothetical protein